ncbi:type IV secretion system protein [Campylobacter fetus subsp. venerealis]|nr:type IV secretion system protein [Campylobacter fetus subsp. venerealis]OCS33210.1 type IV secretion system protein [Campylobacter fetus subsp. venerealis]
MHQNPTKVGLDLISLDNNYTNKYNCNNDESSSFHLCSFRGIDYLPRGCRLVAKTPQNYIKKLSKFFIPLILSTQLVASGIPVVDAAANAQMTMQNAKQAAEWVKEATRWSDTVSHYQKQISAYKDELLSKTGVRDSVSFLSDVKEIYSDFATSGQNINDFYNDVLRDPSGFLSDKGKDIFNKYTSFDRCNYKWMSEAKKRQCQLDLITYAAQIEQYNQTSNQMSDISKNLQKLQTKLQQSKDIKESTDIGNAINLEVAKLQVVKGQMDLANANYETQRRIKEDQAIQDYAESFKKGANYSEVMKEVKKNNQLEW